MNMLCSQNRIQVRNDIYVYHLFEVFVVDMSEEKYRNDFEKNIYIYVYYFVVLFDL